MALLSGPTTTVISAACQRNIQVSVSKSLREVTTPYTMDANSIYSHAFCPRNHD